MDSKKKFKIIFLCLLLALLGYSYLIEPNWLDTTYHQINIDKQGRVISIAHITDLHTMGLGKIEESLITKLEEENPDLILITGDIATPKGTFAGYKEVLEKFKAPLGVYFVPGNWEYWAPIKNLDVLLKELGIINLKNKSAKIMDNLWLAGFDDGPTGNPDLSILNSIPKDTLKISIFHSPSFIKSIQGKVDIAFTGHSHGGQIRIPLIGSIWTPQGTDIFDSGWFEVENTKMYVSRGIGNSILPLRFNCRPEVAFVNVHY